MIKIGNAVVKFMSIVVIDKSNPEYARLNIFWINLISKEALSCAALMIWIVECKLAILW